ncbi:hypothetical protein GCM10010517_35100 [Streptosporangium fragile]|uniref:Uncharacterized protein n=1 Tax=Streptosporangium fragile TaxID=46186 RepID=A0ABP6IE14_9ACTN
MSARPRPSPARIGRRPIDHTTTGGPRTARAPGSECKGTLRIREPTARAGCPSPWRASEGVDRVGPDSDWGVAASGATLTSRVGAELPGQAAPVTGGRLTW